jgi:Flp pilus assembly protein TadD
MAKSLQRILQAHQAGRHEEADAGYRQLVRENPRQADAWHLWGVLAAQRKQHDLAIERIQRALKLKPGEPAFLLNLGNVHLERGAAGEAIRCFRAALDRQPQDGAVARTLARVCERQLDAGIAHQQAGRLVEAEACYRDVLEGQPDRADALHLLGTIALEREQYEEAGTRIRRAIELRPGAAIFPNSLGALLQKQRRLTEAMASYREALRLDPALGSAHSNLGQALAQAGDLAEAEAVLQELLHREPGSQKGGRALADLLLQRGKLTEAEALCRPLLKSTAGDAEMHMLLGRVLYRRKRLSEASEAFQKAVGLQPDLPTLLGWLALTRAKLALWEGEEELHGQILQGLREGRLTSTPFALLAFCDDAEIQRRCAELRASLLAPPSPAPVVPQAQERPSGRLRIAYVSPDFRTHAVAQLMADLLERHDRSRFEVHGVALAGRPDDPWRQRIERSCEQFHDVRELADGAVAERLRGLGIVIAVDLAGYTSSSRLGIFAARAGAGAGELAGLSRHDGRRVNGLHPRRCHGDSRRQRRGLQRTGGDPVGSLPAPCHTNSCCHDSQPAGAGPAGARLRVLLLQQHLEDPAGAVRGVDAAAEARARKRALAPDRSRRGAGQSAPRGAEPGGGAGAAGVRAPCRAARASGTAAGSGSVPRHPPLQSPHHRQ